LPNGALRVASETTLLSLACYDEHCLGEKPRGAGV
jgi:hypothetical protein